MDAYKVHRPNAERPNHNKNIQLIIETHPAQIDALETWLNDKNTLHVWAESNYIAFQIRIRYVPDLNGLPGVKQIRPDKSYLFPYPEPAGK